MISYSPASQLTIEEFKTPFSQSLNPDNRWVLLAKLIPWDELASVYAKNLQHKQGRLSVDVRLVIGALIVKHRLCLSDRETLEMISENVYLQYFCGLKGFQIKKPFDASLFVSIRKRMGSEVFDKFNDLIIRRSEELKHPRKRIMSKRKEGNDDNTIANQTLADKEETSAKELQNKGTLKVDATVADQQIQYPTDLELLNKCRLESERIIDKLHPETNFDKKPRTYRRVAKKDYLNIAKKRKADKKKIRKGIGKQLGYLKRNICSIEKQLDSIPDQLIPLSKRDQNIYWVIQQIYDQQLKMYQNKTHSHENRIVNIYQPYVRPIVRGKDKARVEFGSKINISEYGGMSKIDRISWDAYNESKDLINQVERYRKLYGCYPELLLADKIYMTRANRMWLKDKGIRIVGKPLGRPVVNTPLTPYEQRKLKKERNQRNLVEGKIGQGKNKYGLNSIKARRQDTSESWIQAIFFVMNLQTLLVLGGKYFFLIFSAISNQFLHLKHEFNRLIFRKILKYDFEDNLSYNFEI